ncbi:MAG: molecular chaperone DnaJ [Clostridia bacterium]|nr:molecular chaperone DnaJ [Clostridia bacterium]MBQ6932325.1 molecular chaperone DnaJ [Clostridia bacterium]
MKDPFFILGLHSGASDEQVREAYRNLARRYGEGGESPNAKKMAELDAAYDAIILSRTGNGHSAAGTDYSGYNTYTRYDGTSPDFGDIRAKINSGRTDEAEILLDGISADQRTAEWYYLKGTVSHRKGWLEDAARNFERASQLDPTNPEYRRACYNINSDRAGGYRTERKTEKSTGCDACDLCSGLLCADCCCECMGGDCIPCC